MELTFRVGWVVISEASCGDDKVIDNGGDGGDGNHLMMAAVMGAAVGVMESIAVHSIY